MTHTTTHPADATVPTHRTAPVGRGRHRRRLRRAAAAALGLAAAATSFATAVPATPAAAAFNDQNIGGVTTKFCWTRFDGGFGSGYTVRIQLVNNTASGHVGTVIVGGSGGYTTSMGVSPWSTSSISNHAVSLNLGQTFTYRLDNGQTVYTNMAASAIRTYMTNCEIQLTGNPARDRAMTYATSKVGDYYVGGGSPYRMGEQHADTIKTTMKDQSWYWSLGYTTGWDCSGLMYKAYQAAGVPIDASTAGLMTRPLHPLGSQVPGDLLVKKGHVGMYLGRSATSTTEYVVEATPSNKVSGAGSSASPYTAIGVRITTLANFLASGGVYQVYKPV